MGEGLARKDMVEHAGGAELAGLLQQIIDSGFTDFPHGWTPKDLVTLLDWDGDSALNYKEFLGGLERILLGDDFQLTCLTLATMGKMRCEHRESIKSLGERMENVAGEHRESV